MAILISDPLSGAITSHLIFREGLAVNCDVFKVGELLLYFLPATYFGNPLAWKSKDGYLLAIWLERLKLAEATMFCNEFNSRLFNTSFYISW